MKSVIVYFSLEGNCKYVADKIAEYIDTDILRIDSAKGFPKGNFIKFLWGGKSVVFGETPKLLPYNFNKDEYDLIIIGTPVWAGSFTPPIKTFIKENNLEKKKIALYACSSGGQTDKCFNKLEKELPECNIVKTLSLIDPKIKDLKEDEEKIRKFCSELTVD